MIDKTKLLSYQILTCHPGPVDEELCLWFVFDNDSDTDKEETWENEQEHNKDHEVVETRQP